LILDRLRHPIVQAPMGGGASTPELAAAVSEAGGLGFLAAGYKTTAAFADEVERARELTGSPFGVNLFFPAPRTDPAAYAEYVEGLGAEAERQGTEVGVAAYTDDEWDAKLALVLENPTAVVSFAFGCPDPQVLKRLQEAGSDTWVTVTTPSEASEAEAAGADALVVQGAEAGAHQGSFEDRDEEPIGLLALLQLVSAEVDLPLVATGGIASGAGLAAVLTAGASAAQIGTAFMLSPEAGTSDLHREALRSSDPTELTRAFTGRRARGIVNRFIEEHRDAPSAYPDLHYATQPIRAAARDRGDASAFNLWAGQAHALAIPAPAAEIVERLSSEAAEVLADAGRKLGPAQSPEAG
jgi:nitronate monooxygenase